MFCMSAFFLKKKYMEVVKRFIFHPSSTPFQWGSEPMDGWIFGGSSSFLFFILQASACPCGVTPTPDKDTTAGNESVVNVDLRGWSTAATATEPSTSCRSWPCDYGKLTKRGENSMVPNSKKEEGEGKKANQTSNSTQELFYGSGNIYGNFLQQSERITKNQPKIR